MVRVDVRIIQFMVMCRVRLVPWVVRSVVGIVRVGRGSASAMITGTNRGHGIATSIMWHVRWPACRRVILVECGAPLATQFQGGRAGNLAKVRVLVCIVRHTRCTLPETVLAGAEAR